MDHPMMKCGHAANSVDGDGKPSCVICALIVPGWNEIAESPDLSKRKAHCGLNCGKVVSSSTDLAFFEYRPSKEYDLYYCGCRGWD